MNFDRQNPMFGILCLILLVQNCPCLFPVVVVVVVVSGGGKCKDF